MSGDIAEESSATPPTSDVGLTIELLGRVGVTTTGAAYVVGVLITNFHLSNLGFPPPELVQPRYFVVGALWLALVGGTLATIMWAWSVFGNRWTAGGLRNRVYGTIFALLLASSVGSLLHFASDGSLPRTSLKLWLVTALLFAAAGEAWVVMKSLVRLRTRARAGDDLRVYSIRHYVYQIAWGLASWFILTCLYARAAYPALPAAFGGGRSQSVMLLPEVGKGDVMRRLHLPERADGLFGPVGLEAEDSSTYFLVYRRAGRTVAVRLKKDTCEGVLPEVR